MKLKITIGSKRARIWDLENFRVALVVIRDILKPTEIVLICETAKEWELAEKLKKTFPKELQIKLFREN